MDTKRTRTTFWILVIDLIFKVGEKKGILSMSTEDSVCALCGESVQAGKSMINLACGHAQDMYCKEKCTNCKICDVVIEKVDVTVTKEEVTEIFKGQMEWLDHARTDVGQSRAA